MQQNDLLRAVYRKDLAGVDALLEAGSDINARDPDGRTALMHAVLASDADAETVAALIERGADPKLQDSGQRWTALHFAARDQKTPIVEVLLRAGATTDARDAFGNTPLWRVVMAPKPDLALLRLLLAHGADPDAANEAKVSPRLLAQRMGKAEVLAEFERGS